MQTKSPSRLGEHPETDMIEVVGHLRKLAQDIHQMKGNLAANSAMTQMSLEKQDATEKKVDVLAVKVDSQIARSEELLIIYETGKKGAKFMRSVGRGISIAAVWLLKWVRPVIVAGVIIWGVLHGELPKWPWGEK